jgi:DNA transformation protein
MQRWRAIDEEARKAYAAEGVQPFVITTKEGKFVTSYCELPERLYDDKDELAVWARRAHEVAMRSPAARGKQRAKAKAGARQPARRRRGG